LRKGRITVGDVNDDNVVNIADLSYLSNYLFFGGPEPVHYYAGDMNGDCDLNSGDLSYLAYYLFWEGPAPVPSLAPCE